MALIIFEDEHLLVVNKPAGWNTHAPSPFAGEGLYEWLKNREPRWSKLAIIHRLDKETSGVLVLGKTPEANRSLTQQFTARNVRKKYLLLTDREVKRDAFIVTSRIARAGDRYVSGGGGEQAETRFKVRRPSAERGSSTRGHMGSIEPLPVTDSRSSRSSGKILLEAEPVTGRTHQIRVHAAENGVPILGDSLYGGTRAGRVFLHAASLALRHPITHELIAFEAEPDWLAPSAALRQAIIDTELTDAFRLIHGASDGWPGLYVERVGEFLLAESESSLSDTQRDLLAQLAGGHAARGVYHKLLHRDMRRASVTQASPHLFLGEAARERFTIRENGLRFELSFSEGYSVGLFFDQRDNRRRLLTNHIAAGFPIFGGAAPAQETRKREAPSEVLNVFAYTCGFSVAAAKAGARTTSLDLSKKYLEWGRRNFVLNDLDPAQHDFIYGDALDWMRRLARKGRAFDCLILDPPTFSQSKEGGTWQAERDYGRLVQAALPLLKPRGVLFASTNAAKLEPERFLDEIGGAIKTSRREVLQQHYVPQPPDFPITRAEPAYLKTVWMRVA